MPAPSTRKALPSLHFVVLLALILFLGLALAPRTFEFRAWPEPPRNDAIEEVVDRPAREASRIEVAGVHVRRAEARGHASAADRGSSDRRTRETARARREARSRRESSGRGGQRPDSGSKAPDVVDVVEVVETPPAPAAPPAEERAPEQPAQVAEVPPADSLLRPEVEEHAPPTAPVRGFEAERDEDGQLDVRGRHGRGDRGRRHGRHGDGHHGRHGE